MIKFAVIIPTYHRPNGKSKAYLERSIKSVINQTHKNWMLIIVSDKYEPETELIDTIYSLGESHVDQIILLKNEKVERESIKNIGLLWNVAGATSMNVGLAYARSAGLAYYCHLDDDDYWSENHLALLADAYEKFPNTVFAHTQSTYVNSFLPAHRTEISPNNYLPGPSCQIHSSFSFRCDLIDFMYYTAFTESDIHGPSDADMLGRIRNFVLTNNQYCSIYVSELTCYHDVEGEMSY